jgi:predicted porin
MNLKTKLLLSAATIAICGAGSTLNVRADDTTAAILKRLDALETENNKLRAELKRIETKAPAKAGVAATSAHEVTTAASASPALPARPAAAPGTIVDSNYVTTTAYAGAAAPEDDKWFFRKKPGSSGLTFLTPGGEITAYGQFDVSIDDTTKGISNKVDGSGNHPVGNVGWMPALSTNLSYLGVRGSQNIHDGFKFVYQMETQIDITATAGTIESNSNQSNAVKGALTSRNSFIGFASPVWGSFKAGKTDAPYKNSTAMMNPFSGMLGDYQVIMGNTGGDNRVEFGTRLDHSIWWESPDWGGFTLAALFSPGQNRARNSDNLAAGESDCAGGNSPVSGGFATCSDGAFSNAVSVSGTYKAKVQDVGVLITAAYERHQDVNRSSDLLGIYGIGPSPVFVTPPTGSAIGDALYNADVADEAAAKIGVQVTLPTKTTISGIYESMHRYVPSALAFENERTRNGTWLAITQDLTPKDSISFGWAHAFRAQGDPGQHNDATLTTGDVGAGGPTAFAPNQNQADMLTGAYKHTIKPGLMWYIDYAATINGPSAHYDLGAGGRGVTTDCHDANSNPTSSGGIGANPHCWTGGLLQGVSTGVKFNF